MVTIEEINEDDAVTVSYNQAGYSKYSLDGTSCGCHTCNPNDPPVRRPRASDGAFDRGTLSVETTKCHETVMKKRGNDQADLIRWAEGFSHRYCPIILHPPSVIIRPMADETTREQYLARLKATPINEVRNLDRHDRANHARLTSGAFYAIEWPKPAIEDAEPTTEVAARTAATGNPARQQSDAHARLQALVGDTAPKQVPAASKVTRPTVSVVQEASTSR